MTKEGADYTYPTWSPDGKKIAYTSYGIAAFLVPPRQKIYLMNLNGGEKTELTNGDDITWSPNSSTIIYNRVYHKGDPENTNDLDTYNLYLINVDGNGFDQKIAFIGEKKAVSCWSPDSSKVAVLKDNELFIYSITTSDSTSIKLKSVVSAKWANDGSQIVCAGMDKVLKKPSLFIVAADG